MATLGQYNLDEMTAQEAVEASFVHLLEQSVRSMSPNHTILPKCAYKGSEGTCCAAGIFIQNYEESMENSTWLTISKYPGESDAHNTLVESLQEIHDGIEVCNWLIEMKSFCEFNELDDSFLNGWSWNGSKYIK
jgi:hypothetical protein